MSDRYTRPVRRWDDFYKDFYSKPIYLWEVDHAFIAWFVAHRRWDDKWYFDEHAWSLRFTAEDFNPWPLRTVDIIAVNDGEGNIIRVRLQTHNNVSDPWDYTLEQVRMLEVIEQFLRVDNPEEELVRVTLGPYRPVFEDLRRLLDYPPCSCLGCESPACVVKKWKF